MAEKPTITFRDVKFTFWKTNFSGDPSRKKYNGERKTFDIVIEDEVLAKKLIEDGWKVKFYENSNDPFYYLEVEVRYKPFPPTIYTIDTRTRRKTLLTDDTVGMLDFARIEKVNLEISGNPWDVNGKSGIKAYVSYMNVFIQSNPFADDFDDLAETEEDVPF